MLSLWTGMRVTLLWYKPCCFSNANYFVIMLTRYWSLSQGPRSTHLVSLQIKGLATKYITVNGLLQQCIYWNPGCTPYTPPAIKKINLINDNTYCIHIHGNWLNLKRRTTETILRTSTPRMMVILRQGFRRISRCSLGIMKLCLSFFLWLYQFIMRENDQNTPEAVQHDYLEGKTGFFSVRDRIVLIEV